MSNGLPPIVTPVASVKLVPVIVTTVPPATGPLFGPILVTVGIPLESPPPLDEIFNTGVIVPVRLLADVAVTVTANVPAAASVPEPMVNTPLELIDPTDADHV